MGGGGVTGGGEVGGLQVEVGGSQGEVRGRGGSTGKGGDHR